MKWRVVTVEDEEPARAGLRELIIEVEWLDLVGEAANGRDAVPLIDELKPDVVFLDIQLPEQSGIDVIRAVSHRPLFILTTAHDQYAVSAFELQALDYLMKPFGRERFTVAVERAKKILMESDDIPSASERAAEAITGEPGALTRIFVRDRGKITPILVREIERLEAEDDYVAVFARGRRHLVYLTLAEFERRLDPVQFLRIHRAHIVNLDFVSHLEPYDAGRLRVTMRDGTALMASRVRSKELRHMAI
ncbi:MAG TPA: LytTR family DNA-binding domain-containing protein [Gemmatimonadaceae bacterium]|nr:LytTR family DNA-binding domain-containing protein [Gemmatimonadaceae bacterium]